MNRKMKMRMERLTIAKEKLCDQIANFTVRKNTLGIFDDKASRAILERKKVRLAEVELHISNIDNYGYEVEPNGLPTGVSIGVPTAGRMDN